MTDLLQTVRRCVRLFKTRSRFPQARIHDQVVVDRKSQLGMNVVLFSRVNVVESDIGAYTYIQADTTCYDAEIGPFCSVAPEVVIGLVDHPTHFVSSSPVFYDNTQPLPRFFVDKPLTVAVHPRTVIGADVWIGQRAMIKAGVHIGVGAIIGAQAIVTGNVAPYSVVAGSPARVLRMRFEPSVIGGLLRTRWWEHSEQVLIELAQYFDNPHKFILAAEELRASSS